MSLVNKNWNESLAWVQEHAAEAGLLWVPHQPELHIVFQAGLGYTISYNNNNNEMEVTYDTPVRTGKKKKWAVSNAGEAVASLELLMGNVYHIRKLPG